MQSPKPISEEEKRSIESILDEFEFENVTPEQKIKTPEENFQNLLDIDSSCGKIWPGWQGHSYIPTATPKNRRSIIQTSSNYTCYSPTFPSISQSTPVINSTTGSLKSVHFSEDCLSSSARPRFEKKETIQPEMSNEKARELDNGVTKIKDDIIDVMNKLTDTIDSYDLVPDLVDADDIQESVEESKESDEIPVKEKIDPLTLRTKAQIQADVIKLQREIIAEKEEKQNLENELKKIREDIIKSQKRMINIRNELKKSNIVYNEMKRRDDEYNAKHPTPTIGKVNLPFFSQF